MVGTTIRTPLPGYAPPPGPPPPWEVRGAVEELRQLVRALDSVLPDPADGEAWARFDQAMGDLHRALVLLDVTGATGRPDVTRSWSGTILPADALPVPPH